MEEKLRAAELIAKASFIKKKRDAEDHAESLQMEGEVAKATAKVYDDTEGIDLEIGLPIDSIFVLQGHRSVFAKEV